MYAVHRLPEMWHQHVSSFLNCNAQWESLLNFHVSGISCEFSPKFVSSGLPNFFFFFFTLWENLCCKTACCLLRLLSHGIFTPKVRGNLEKTGHLEKWIFSTSCLRFDRNKCKELFLLLQRQQYLLFVSNIRVPTEYSKMFQYLISELEKKLGWVGRNSYLGKEQRWVDNDTKKNTTLALTRNWILFQEKFTFIHDSRQGNKTRLYMRGSNRFGDVSSNHTRQKL